MSITPRQEKLYEAVTAIDETYLQEACTSGWRLQPTRLIRRLTAIAALLAIVISITFLSSPNSDRPLYAIVVHASDELDVCISVNAELVTEHTPNSGHIKEELDHEWMDKELFHIQITLDNSASIDIASLHVKLINLDESYFLNDYLTVLEGSEDRNVICDIYGWTDKEKRLELNFAISVYQDNDNLLCSMPVNVYYSKWTEVLCVNNSAIGNGKIVNWSMYLMTTNQLVKMISTDDNLPSIGLLSDPTQYLSLLYARHAGTLAVLQTRSDAGSAMIKEIKRLISMEYEDFSIHFDGYIALYTLVSRDEFKKTLSQEDLTWLEEFDIYSLDSIFGFDN